MKATVLMVAMVAACGGPTKPAPAAAPASAPAPAPAVVEPAKPAAADPAVALALMDKLGCVACHSTDGSAKVGPTLKHYFGATFKLADGTAVVGDEASFRASLKHARDLEGFTATMPSYEALITPGEADLLIAYVKTL